MLVIAYSLHFAAAAVPFSPGERLVFDLSWHGINSGTSVFEVRDAVYDNHSVLKISSTVKSNSFISMFYPIKDVVESYIDATNYQPYRYRSVQQEGSYRSDKEILFDREKNVATFINHKSGGKSQVIEIPEGVHDPLSVVYYLRTIPVQAGQTINIDVNDGRKNWTLVAIAMAKERLNVPAGTFDTIKVKTLIKYEGLSVNKGDVIIWFTDDEIRMPVKMVSRLKIGSITAILTEKHGRM